MGFLEICKGHKLVRYGSRQNGCGCECVNSKDPNFIYTDGSLYKKTGQGGYGIYSSGLNMNFTNYYDYQQHRNIVARIELKAILEAVKHVKLHHQSRRRIDIFTDCEFALVHLVNLIDGKEGPQVYNNLGTAILREIKDDHGWLVNVVLHKVKAHSGIEGNQVADQYAKMGAKKAPKLYLVPQTPVSINSVHYNREQNDEFYSTSSASFNSCRRKASRLSHTLPSLKV